MKADITVAAEVALVRMLLHNTVNRMAEHRRELRRQRAYVEKLEHSLCDTSAALVKQAEIEAGLAQSEFERNQLRAELEILEAAGNRQKLSASNR